MCGFLLVCYSNIVPKTYSTSKNVVTLISRVRGHLRSLKMVPFDRLCMVSYYYPIATFFCKMHHFWDIRLQKCRDLENRAKGPWRLLRMSPFDREPMTSYWLSVVTMALSHVVSEIFNVEKYRGLEIPVKSQSRSLKVLPFDRLGMVSY